MTHNQTRRTADDWIALLGPKVKPEALLAELEDLLRTKPALADIGNGREPALEWLGRAAAAIGHWDSPTKISIVGIESDLHSLRVDRAEPAYRKLITLLNQARHSIRLATVGPTSIAVEQGRVFDYFDELRKIVERASNELFFVDPYLDAEFVSRYLRYAPGGVGIRLLTRKQLASLLPAIDALAGQAAINIQVRSTAQLHDRYVFVDAKECFQSGASFKDGAVKAPTTLTQITDAFSAMLQTYEGIWSAAKVERS